MRARRLKLLMLLGGILLGGLVLLSWTQTWFEVVLVDGPTLAVGGDVAAAALATLALTCLVLNGALSIAGPVFRVVLGSLEALLGLTVVLSGALALADPIEASAAAISDATGVSGPESVAAAVAAVSASFWPWVSTAAGVLLAGVGVAVVATARLLPGSGRRYSALRLESSDGTPVDDWDALSHGDDPT